MIGTTQMTGVTKYIGVPRKRGEDPMVLMGQAKYVDDIRLPGLLEVAFLRSSHSHAQIKGIDLDQARRHPDCVAMAADSVRKPISSPKNSFCPG